MENRYIEKLLNKNLIKEVGNWEYLYDTNILILEGIEDDIFLSIKTERINQYFIPIARQEDAQRLHKFVKEILIPNNIEFTIDEQIEYID